MLFPLGHTRQTVYVSHATKQARTPGVIMSEEICSLSQRECKPCQGGVPPLAGEALEQLASELGNDWHVIDGHHLEKEYSFKNFAEALAFTNQVGALAEEIFHHPDIFLAWGTVRITIWTHKIDGLNEADFIFAAKADALL
jgi:4a-hydroxytetrahydrobiopterin dehydratase